MSDLRQAKAKTGVLLLVLLLTSAPALGADGGACQRADAGFVLPKPFVAAPYAPLEPGTVEAIKAAMLDVTGPFPAGLSVGVLHGEKAWFGAIGFAEAARKRPATPGTSYRMASVTKSFTAVAVMQLVEAGRLGLDDEIQLAVPSFPKKSSKITARQLLGHLSGIQHYRHLPSERVRRPVNTREALALFESWELAFEPGSKFLYTTYGYNLLGAAIECTSGLRYADYLARFLFGPLGMTASDIERPARRDRSWAAGYALRGGRLEPAAPLELSSRLAGGGTRSTVEDLIRYGRALLEGALLSAGSHRLMRTVQVTADGNATDYGLGFAVFPQRGHYLVTHAGGQAGASALLVLIPAERFALALASNLEDQKSLLNELSQAIQAVVLDGGAVRRPVDAVDPLDGLLHEALFRIQSYGLAVRSFPPAADGLADEAKLEQAFAKVSALLAPSGLSAPEARQQILDGHQPREGQPLVRVGLHMAGQIAKALGPARLAEGRSLGPLVFFEDYRIACGHLKCAHRFPAELEGKLRALGQGWQRANHPAIRTMRISASPQPQPLAELLRPALKDAPLRPDLSGELARAGLRLAVEKKQAPRARELLMLASELYPRSIPAQLGWVDWLVLQGQQPEARTRLQQLALQPEAQLSKQLLEKRANQLTSWGRAGAAKRLRELSRELFSGRKAAAPEAKQPRQEEPAHPEQ